MKDEFYKIYENEKVLEIFVNKNLFSKKAVIITSYNFLDKNYIMFDESDEKYIIILKPKTESVDLEKLAWEFFTKIIEEEALLCTAEFTEKIREEIINKAVGNYIEKEQIEMEEQAYQQENIYREEVDKAMSSFRAGEEVPVEDLFIEDPLGIAKTWEEKYGKIDSK